jgi:hypothetical protein
MFLVICDKTKILRCPKFNYKGLAMRESEINEVNQLTSTSQNQQEYSTFLLKPWLNSCADLTPPPQAQSIHKQKVLVFTDSRHPTPLIST